MGQEADFAEMSYPEGQSRSSLIEDEVKVLGSGEEHGNCYTIFFTRLFLCNFLVFLEA